MEGSGLVCMDEEADFLRSGPRRWLAGSNGRVSSLASVYRSAKRALYARLSRKRAAEVRAVGADLKFASVNRSISGCAPGG